MNRNGKLRFLMRHSHKRIPAHEFFYPNEYKGPPKPEGYDLLLIHR